jgi:hypothetical protein
MEKSQFVDIAILDETPVRRLKHIAINRNQILVEILDRKCVKWGLAFHYE